MKARRFDSSAPARALGDLGPNPAIDTELRWFFCADGDFASESNFGRMFSSVTDDGAWRTPEDHAVANRRHRTLRSVLRSMADRDAGVLQCAYLPRPWPIRLSKALGPLTGIVVRLSCDRASWPEPRGEQLAVDLQNADRLAAMLVSGSTDERATLAALKREAQARFTRAIERFVSARRRRGVTEVA